MRRSLLLFGVAGVIAAGVFMVPAGATVTYEVVQSLTSGVVGKTDGSHARLNVVNATQVEHLLTLEIRRENGKTVATKTIAVPPGQAASVTWANISDTIPGPATAVYGVVSLTGDASMIGVRPTLEVFNPSTGARSAVLETFDHTDRPA